MVPVAHAAANLTQVQPWACGNGPQMGYGTLGDRYPPLTSSLAARAATS